MSLLTAGVVNPLQYWDSFQNCCFLEHGPQTSTSHFFFLSYNFAIFAGSNFANWFRHFIIFTQPVSSAELLGSKFMFPSQSLIKLLNTQSDV